MLRLHPVAVGLLLLSGLLSGCQRRLASSPASSRAEAAARIDPAALGADCRTTLRALRMTPQRLARSLGAHRLTCSSRLLTRLPGQPAQEVSQQVTVRVDGQHQYASLKTTHPQYGHEVIWTGGWLYPRLRWNKFLRRRAEPDEPSRLLDRLAGLLPAYVGLLRRFVAVEPLGRASHLGRDAVRVKLALAAHPAPPRDEAGTARQWRRTLVVSKLAGEALLDARTGAPLQARLSARWSFNAPAPGPLPASGIPERLDPKLLGQTELEFSLQVSEIGKVAAIAPPPEADTLESPKLTRPEIERQMLTGELPLEDDWGPP